MDIILTQRAYRCNIILHGGDENVLRKNWNQN